MHRGLSRRRFQSSGMDRKWKDRKGFHPRVPSVSHPDQRSILILKWHHRKNRVRFGVGGATRWSDGPEPNLGIREFDPEDEPAGGANGRLTIGRRSLGAA